MSVADVLDTSVVNDIGDGDDHQEYGYINNSPEFKSSDVSTIIKIEEELFCFVCFLPFNISLCCFVF